MCLPRFETFALLLAYRVYCTEVSRASVAVPPAWTTGAHLICGLCALPARSAIVAYVLEPPVRTFFYFNQLREVTTGARVRQSLQRIRADVRLVS